MKRFLLLAVFLLAFTSLLPATTYYVSTSGTNSAGCGSSGSPCATMAYVDANKSLTGGDTVIVNAGTYTVNPNLTLSKSGSSTSSKLTWQANGAVKIVSNGATNNYDEAVRINGSYVVFTGFEVTSTNTTVLNVGINAVGSYDEIRNNVVHDIPMPAPAGIGGCGICSSLNGTNGHNVADSNLVYNIGTLNPTTISNRGHGIYFSTPYAVISNNIIHHSRDWGVQVGHGAGYATIVNNTIFSNGNGGIVVDLNATDLATAGLSAPGHDIKMVNNIVYNNGISPNANGYGIQEFNACSGGNLTSPNYYLNNMVFSNLPGNWKLQTTGATACGGSGNINAVPTSNKSSAPQFKNWQADGSGDYSPASQTSNLVDAGTSNSAPSTDYVGTSRPQLGGYDIGAYEYIGAAGGGGGGGGGGVSQPSNGIVMVQSKGATGNNVSSQAVAMNGNTASGNTMVIAVRYTTGVTITGVTDSQGHTFTKATSATHASGFGVELWYYAGTSAAAETVTVTLSGSSSWVFVSASEFSGIDTSSPLDKTVTASGDSNSATATTATTTTANEVMVSIVGLGSLSSVSITPDIYTSLASEDATSARAYAGYRMVTSTGAYGPTYNLSGTTPSWVLAVATFKKSSAVTTVGVTVPGSVTQIRARASDPSTCGQNDGDVYWNTSTNTIRACNQADTFINVGYFKASATATLNFPSVTAPGCSDLTVTAAGTAVGDAVILGVPNGSVPSGGVFFAWGSATDTVTVRFCALVTGDPASGTFKVIVPR